MSPESHFFLIFINASKSHKQCKENWRTACHFCVASGMHRGTRSASDVSFMLKLLKDYIIGIKIDTGTCNKIIAGGHCVALLTSLCDCVLSNYEIGHR